jgi:class 3 adenylate cyclase/tetratricopeptide (TPR) repeat protein
MKSLADWLQERGFERYAAAFTDNDIDFEALSLLGEIDLERLGVSLGHRKKLLKALAGLSGNGARETNPEPPSQAPSQRPIRLPGDVEPRTGERRQITVLVCDMVGSTELTSRLDPELVSMIMRRYEDACAAAITRYEGYVFERRGDGVVAFFGYPFAHEGEAERAVRAGLQIILAVGDLGLTDAGRLQVRVGIATGLVVVSQAESGQRLAAGDAMNLAARLQALASPDSIAIAERTHQLAGGWAEYEDIGLHALKGIPQPVRVWRVLGLSEASSRFDAATRSGLTPLVGRELEIALLLERWQRAQEGEGEVVLLSGEPGIGKSRVLRALRERLSEQGAVTLQYQCSPYHVNTAFHPFADHLERVLRLRRDEPADAKLDKLESLVVGLNARPLQDARLLAPVLGINAEDRHGPLGMQPQRQKDETIRAIVDLLEVICRRQPTLILLEDVHWADATSIEVLEQLLDRVARTPLLVVITSRPEFQPPWGSRLHLTAMTVTRLSRAQSATLVSRVAGGKALPQDLADQIIAKTEGVPLFLEEITKAVLEAETLRDAGERYEYSGPAQSVQVPDTLRDSLMARLDRLGKVKEIAQIGAALGRKFNHELLSAVAQMPQPELDLALKRLAVAGLVSCRGLPPDAVYVFKHAMVQDVAYDSLLKSKRQDLHGRIARVIEERVPDAEETEPELLAYHYTAAGLIEAAIPHWRRAGELALRVMALKEAIAHLQKGLDLIAAMPPSLHRDIEELQLRTLLGTAWMARRGWPAAEVGIALRPALPLIRSTARVENRLPILYGMWIHVLNQGRIAESLRWVDEMMEASAAAPEDDALEITAHRAAMASQYWLGNFIDARRHGELVQTLYDAKRHWRIATLLNNDPLTSYGNFASPCLWMLGYPDEALRVCRARDDHARKRGHPFDLGHALTGGSDVFDYRVEPEELLARALEAQAIGKEHGMSFLADVMAQVAKGIASLRSGRVSESIAQLRAAIAMGSAHGAYVKISYLKACLAEATTRDGDPHEGLRLAAESVAQIERPGWEERSHYAEVLRINGWILRTLSRLDEAESRLRASIDVARSQQARSWELRASTTLARMLAERGDRGAARDLVTPIYAWFTEGFDTHDLKQARQLLEDLD